MAHSAQSGSRQGAITERRNFTDGPAVRPYHLAFFSLRHKHGEALAGAAGFDEFAHRQFVAAVAAVLQRRDEPRRAFGQDNISLDDDRIA
jgi:hypothetical protein